MELDHIFILTTPSAPEVARLEAIGLTPTYRRDHVGQGTANVCYCFENAFLEVLWVTSSSEARNPAVARMQLAERAEWRTAETSPFGIAWRGEPGRPSTIPTWQCRPPYLPSNLAIEVATESDDLQQPLMFAFPGSRAPAEWPASRRGDLQAARGFRRLELSTVWLPPDMRPSATLRQLAAACKATINVGTAIGHALDVVLTQENAEAERTLRLPACEVLL